MKKEQAQNLEFVGTVIRDKSVVKILRQFAPVNGFEYFLEEGGELKPFDAFGEREYRFRMPYPVELDQLIHRRSVDLKVYHIEDDDWDAEIGGQKIREWCEKALRYYEGEEEMDFWREYWGLLKDERETMFSFFEKFLREKKNISNNEWWELRKFHRTILNLGEYREKVADILIDKLADNLGITGSDGYLRWPKNKAKGLLVWVKEHDADLRDFLNGLVEWDALTAEECEEVEDAIYDRIWELAEEEEAWAGLSLEEWLDLLKRELIKRREIKDDAGFWKLLKRRVDREDLYRLLDWVFEENADWYWMPRKEKRELASALEEYIIEKLEADTERTA
ncbi:MAG: hypothetical protein ACO2PP_04270 [Thermocrinis sp.]|jgi:hypothetical protein|uniref:hypothetical protein n=1 Tax=Thermocrinis sp. TaxID=2024383 RepID=UPI003BFFFD3A